MTYGNLFRYYSASPNASVIRIDLLDLTIADTGITLDLDKDWHSDLYEHHDASIETFFLFLHMYELTRERTFGGFSLLLSGSILPFRYEKSTSVRAEVPIS